MGSEFEVWIWVTDGGWSDYEFVKVYAGNDYEVAMQTMKDQKAKGVGCVKFYWRG